MLTQILIFLGVFSFLPDSHEVDLSGMAPGGGGEQILPGNEAAEMGCQKRMYRITSARKIAPGRDSWWESWLGYIDRKLDYIRRHTQSWRGKSTSHKPTKQLFYIFLFDGNLVLGEC